MKKMEYEDYGKRMLIYAGIAIVGIFFGLQAMFGFPYSNHLRAIT
jgi:hypothetical protein